MKSFLLLEGARNSLKNVENSAFARAAHLLDILLCLHKESQNQRLRMPERC
jgi:hypothetical protein